MRIKHLSMRGASPLSSLKKEVHTGYKTNEMKNTEIKNIRSSLRLTQEQFARKVMVSVRTVARWEAGSSSPRGLHLVVLREVERGL